MEIILNIIWCLVILVGSVLVYRTESSGLEEMGIGDAKITGIYNGFVFGVLSAAISGLTWYFSIFIFAICMAIIVFIAYFSIRSSLLLLLLLGLISILMETSSI